MKLGPNVLLEIVEIVRQGLTPPYKDVSQLLRDIEFVEDPTDPGKVTLTDEYVAKRNQKSKN